MAEFAGEFETHFTVEVTGAQRIPALAQWATARQMKCTHILLDRGRVPSQPMLTSHGQGTLSNELQKARRVTDMLHADGFRVTRIKIEASPKNQDIPQRKEDPFDNAEQYFEHHVKLLLEDDSKLESLSELAQRHCAHLSHNVLRTRADGRHERFVTQRCYRVGQPQACAELSSLLADLEREGYQILETEQEFVVYDSNLAMDGGWIDSGGNE